MQEPVTGGGSADAERASPAPDAIARAAGQHVPRAAPMHGTRRRRLRSSLVSFLGYTVLFAALSASWLRSAHRGAPAGYLGNAADERLVVWVLAWIAHALGTSPASVLDAGINHPAPAQLTGTEHFATFQALFAPLWALTDNALLAANLTVFLTYPLAALAMQRLLLALGCTFGVASVVGLVFAVGPLRAPAHLHLLQYANLFLPAVALCLTKLRDRPDVGRAALLAIALIAAALSSYYMALLSGVLAVLWGAFELFERRGPRVRFLVLAGVAGAVASAAILVATLPWLARPEVAHEAEFNAAQAASRELFVGLFASRAVRSAGTVALVLGGFGVAGFLAHDRAARLCARRGLVITLLAQLTAIGPVLTIGGMLLPTPFALVASSPARFFRYPVRFVVLLGFGTSLLAAAALQTVSTTCGRRVGRAAVVLTAILFVATQGVKLPGKRITEFRGQTDPAYDMVARVTRGRGSGALLEMPVVIPIADHAKALGTEVQSMLGSTRHWLPLVVGFTGYQPVHRALVMQQIKSLPDPQALQWLVDMTHVRWILLQPPASWPKREAAQRERIRRSPLLRQIAAVDGWVLLRVKKKPRDLGWYEAIATGPRPGRTVLGTSLAPIPEEDAVAELDARAANPMPAGGVGLLTLAVRNAGSAPWPASDPSTAECACCVRVVVEWWHAGERDRKPPVKSQRLLLPIDLPPGDAARFPRWVQVPEARGRYDLRLRVEQTGGATFSTAGNRPADLQIDVEPPPSTGVKAPARRRR